jgi:hypothetical protein
VLMLIASSGFRRKASLWELYCVLDVFGNAKGCAGGY